MSSLLGSSLSLVPFPGSEQFLPSVNIEIVELTVKKSSLRRYLRLLSNVGTVRLWGCLEITKYIVYYEMKMRPRDRDEMSRPKIMDVKLIRMEM